MVETVERRTIGGKNADLQRLIDVTLRKATPFTRTVLGKPLSAREVAGFINTLQSGVLATTKPDGSSHLAAMLFAYVDNRLYTCAHPKSLCYKNMLRDARMSAAFAEKGGKGRTVILEGRAKTLGPVRKLRGTVLARIEGEIGPWYARSSATHSSLDDDESKMIQIIPDKVFTYSG